MLQPRRFIMLACLVILCLAATITGYENIESTRVRRQNDGDVTTVLLVDNHGRSSLGRFLSVKPAVGLLTSTARTFIQEGVTTEYATQVLGTTLDNGRLYAHLLTKSSRVLYDNDLPTKSYNDFQHKKWNFDNHVINKNIHFVKNTDYISPNKADAFLVFPTQKIFQYRKNEEQQEKPLSSIRNEPMSEEELLNIASSNNARVPYQEPYFRQKQSFSSSSSSSSTGNNVKIFKVNPAERHINLENFSREQSTENDILNNPDIKDLKYELLSPTKIKPKMNIPTFTVRNDFSPSGYSFLGDLPEFEYDINTEKSKPTTPAERRAKLLFRGGQPVRQELKDLETVTYMGFADFTTTVGDTVIIFSPHTSASPLNFNNGQVTSISGEATISPTKSYNEATVTSTIKTFMSHDPAMQTETVTGHKFTMRTVLPTMVINASNRHREPKKDESEEEKNENLHAKLAVLAHEQDTNQYDVIEQNTDKYETVIEDNLEPSLVETTEDDLETVVTPEIFTSEQQPELTTIYNPEIIQPSETTTSTLMLSTPSDEDIAKIFASLAALAAKNGAPASSQATEPLVVASTESSIEETPVSETETKVLGGATTIFFEDDFNPFTTFDTFSSSQAPVKNTTPLPPTTLEQEVTTENLPTTLDQQQETTFNFPATEKPTTTEKQIITTEKEIFNTEKLPTTLNEIIPTSEESISTLSLEETTPEGVNEQTTKKINEDNDIKVSCSDGGKIVPTTVFKTLTYLTTFFIPVETTTTTSVKSNVVVSTEIGFQTQSCIASSSVQDNTTPIPTVTTEKLTTKAEETTVDNVPELTATTEQLTTFESNQETTPMETTPFEITTESKHVTEFESEPLETTTDSGEEIELIFKTLYTTYTYLTTFFQESTSSVSSRKEVITNVITSTLDPAKQVSDPAVAGLFARDDTVVLGTEYKSKPASFEDFADIATTQTTLVQPTVLTTTQETDSGAQENESNQGATPALSEENLIQTTNAIKTYYTTYTYFTTIFVDGETEISSRTEVYTNYVTPSGTQDTSELVIPTAAVSIDAINELPKNQADKPETNKDETESSRQLQLKVTPVNSYNSTISRQKTATTQDTEDSTEIYEKEIDNIDNNILTTSTTDLEPSHSYTTLQRSKPVHSEATQVLENKIFNINDYETISTMVTDVRSSSSSGERRFIDNVDKRNVLDDQVVAESNNDSEISPSPTLLLQTSFTTFTYFTTMYYGTTSSNVVSRLETITNVVTETLTPTQTLTAEDLSLPITYFTTFTYWTTLYKDGSTTITSREDTVSNVVTPSASSTETSQVITQTIEPTATIKEKVVSTTNSPKSSSKDDDELTTFFTTYTYYTTSYLGNSTILNSRLETVTNVLNNTAQTQAPTEIIATESTIVDNAQTSTTATPTLFPTGLLSTMVDTIVENGATTLFSTDIYGTYIDGLYAKVLESTTKLVTEQIAPSSVTPLLPTGVISLNQGKIVDAEGVSTLFYKTEAIGTYIDNLYAKVVESTSSLTVNEERKAALPTDLDPVALAHRTGLVRLIEGSMVANKTTTIYQSKVLGTIIEGRYAQIIESTSSFIVEKTQAPSATQIKPTATIGPDGKITPTTSVISPSPVVIESSLNEETNKPDEENTTEEEEEGYDEEDDENNGGNSRVKSRLTFQTKKRTFTPAIRPFASRNRPTFNPKRKGATANGPTTITRTDFTPTIIATPALKADSTRGRFNGNRRQSSNAAIASITPSGSRRFSRPKTTSSGGPSSGTFGANRRSSSGRIQPTVSGSRRGGGGFRTSSAVLPGRASSNLFASRGRIRPTLSSSLLRGQATVTTPSSDSTDGGNDLTTLVTDEPTDFTDDDSDTTVPLSTTTESALARRRNPLLRFSRPPLPRPNAAATSPRPPTTPKKNGNLRKATTTTPKPKGRALTRPVPPASNRPRPGGNGLFPRRDLFKPRTPPPEELKEEEEEDIQPGDDLDLEEDEDTEYEGSDTNTQTEKVPLPANTRKSRAYNPLKSFVRRRAKRQVNYSRFRRPIPGKSTTSTTTTEAPTEAPKSLRTSKNARFRPRTGTTTTSAPTSPPKRIIPSRASSNQGRSQFTLREKDSSSRNINFKRPSSRTNIRTTSKPATLSRPKAPRLRTTTSKSSEESSYRNANSRTKPTTSRSNRARARAPPSRSTEGYTQRSYRDDINDNFVLPVFDGTVTITHQIPTEATIPVVNGKITEYKNIVTAKLSTEVLGPQQYTTRINTEGKEVKVLTSESTNIGLNGATEITQFVLNETPTTSVVFTPTYIRGRRTSFSHVIPSTVYGVEHLVSTIQPQLSAQAPLANILLSQLLLGNLGLPQQNPLLALQNQGSGTPQTPTTEFKTRTTTYVTTVTDATSTVIPLTFRGKEILTTIVDSSINVITATEFITETVVVTPTAALQNNNQLNSLLLPLLLQQQQQPAANPQIGQPGLQQTTGLLPLEQPLLLQDNVANDLQNGRSKEIDEELPEENPSPRKKIARIRPRAQRPTEPTPPKETSVITLYVSGKRPGEFSTVLSTVIVGEENRRKREIPVQPSKVLAITGTRHSMMDSYIMPAMSDIYIESSQASGETESLESIIGDVNKYIHSTNIINTGTKYVTKSVTNKAGSGTIPSGNFLS